jgi:hypothetical protein
LVHRWQVTLAQRWSTVETITIGPLLAQLFANNDLHLALPIIILFNWLCFYALIVMQEWCKLVMSFNHKHETITDVGSPMAQLSANYNPQPFSNP